ncbi:MAG TPA: NUDIX domain-containing protein [Verrucomicrobiae bacterium]|nr:NUDIX domain-containing protein [Verrucomicrobiae bacterium]
MSGPMFEGVWDGGQTWEIYLSPVMPDVSLCSAVACIAIHDLAREEVVLTRNPRGWEILAGHIEQGETPVEAMQREALEEGGFAVKRHELFGYRKVTATERRGAPGQRGTYSFPISYILHYYAFSDSERVKEFGEEVTDSRVFTLDQIRELVRTGQTSETDLAIIESGLASAKAAAH